jgi:hypothetical protein
MKKQILLFILVVTSQVSFSQSPWTKEKGKSYVQLGFSGLFYDLYADENGKKQELNGTVSDITIQAYAEYGLTNKLTANLIVPYKTISFENNLSNQAQSHSGIGNISVGLKYKLSDKNWKMSSGVLFTANSISKNETNFLATGFNSSTILPYFTIGTSKNKWYYYGNLGYGYMNNDYSDFFRFNGEIGYEAIPKGHIIFAVETKNILSEEDAFDNDVYSNLSNSDRQNYNAFGIKLNYEIKKDKFGINFAGFGAFDNKNAPLAPTLNLGVYSKF